MSSAAAVEFTPEYVAYNEGPVVLGVSWALAIIAVITVCLRVAVRLSQNVKFGVEDWLIICGAIIIVVVTGLVVPAVQNGVGRHLPIVMAEDPNQLGVIEFYLFLTEFTYGTALTVVKLSILFMYHRIFPTQFMKMGTRLVGVLAVAWWVGTMLATLFQCNPIDKVWHPFMTTGSCMDKNKFFIGNAIPNIFIDVVMLALPIMEIKNLQMPRSQRAAIAGIFLVGAIVVVISIIRLSTLIELLRAGETGDFTHLVAPPWILTIAEPSIGTVSASLPTMKPLLRAVFTNLFPRKRRGETRPSAPGVVTIGGSGGRMRKGGKGGVQDDSFQELHDDDSDLELTRRGDLGDRKTAVVGNATPSLDSDEIPMNTIAVKHDMTWSESRPGR